MNFLKPKFWDDNKISLLSILLFPISLLFKLLNFLKRSLTKSNKSPIPVICVGNIYLGGTGKTPLCIEIFSILKKLNVNPVFIRKHYDLYQDEVELQKKIGPVYQSKKRIEAIKKAVMDKADIAILDDGFQDFSIKKNLSIVCFNEKQWLGNGLNIPAGPLRENFSAIKRANCIVVNGEKNEKIENQVFSISKELKIFYSKYEPQNINNFKNAQVIAFAVIGNPKNFFDLLKKNKIHILEELNYPDHHKYSKNELEKLIKKSKEKNAVLLTTEKDYFRIEKDYKVNVKYLKIKLKIENQDLFINEIKKII